MTDCEEGYPSSPPWSRQLVKGTPVSIHVFPNGSKSGLEGNVSVALANLSREEVTFASVEFITGNYKRKCSKKDWVLQPRTAAVGSVQGIGKFLSHNACKKLLTDDTFEVTAIVEKPGTNADN